MYEVTVRTEEKMYLVGIRDTFDDARISLISFLTHKDFKDIWFEACIIHYDDADSAFDPIHSLSFYYDPEDGKRYTIEKDGGSSPYLTEQDSDIMHIARIIHEMNKNKEEE